MLFVVFLEILLILIDASNTCFTVNIVLAIGAITEVSPYVWEWSQFDRLSFFHLQIELK